MRQERSFVDGRGTADVTDPLLIDTPQARKGIAEHLARRFDDNGPSLKADAPTTPARL
jgi:hypothetical protein